MTDEELNALQKWFDYEKELSVPTALKFEQMLDAVAYLRVQLAEAQEKWGEAVRAAASQCGKREVAEVQRDAARTALAAERAKVEAEVVAMINERAAVHEAMKARFYKDGDTEARNYEEAAAIELRACRRRIERGEHRPAEGDK